MSRQSFKFFTPLTLLLAGGSTLVAQSFQTGALLGVVKDANGRPLAAVQVRAHSGQSDRVAVTNAKGEYRFNLLNLGEWKLSVFANGFYAVTGKANVGINETHTANFKLMPVTGTTVEVTAKVEDLDHTTTQITHNLSSELLTALPADLTSTNALDGIMATIPGVQVDPSGGAKYYFSGATAIQNLFIVDGNNTNSVYDNSAFASANNQPPREFMAGMEVISGGQGAEYNALGGVINVTTKSGSNTWAGEVYWYSNFPNSSAKQKWNTEFWGTAPVVSSFKRWGATVSGPIVTDKLFFFLGYQDIRQAIPPTGTGGANWNGLISDETKNNGPSIYSFKVNWIPNSVHQFILSRTLNKLTSDSGHQYPNATGYLGSVGSMDSGVKAVNENINNNLTWNWTLSPELFLVTSVGNHHEPSNYSGNTGIGYNDYQYFVTGPGRNAANRPIAYLRTQNKTGAPLSGPQTGDVVDKQIRVDLTWIHGNHQIKAGFLQQKAEEYYTAQMNPQYYIYSPSVPWTNSGVTTDLERLTIASSSERIQGTYTSYYLKDLWEALPGLRVDVGLRIDPFRVTAGTPGFEGTVLMDYQRVKDLYQPRIAVIWDPFKNGKTKLYANWGRFFKTMPLATFTWANTSSTVYEDWNASQWTYNTNYQNGQAPFTIQSDPATGKAYTPYRTKQYTSAGSAPTIIGPLKVPQKLVWNVGVDQVLGKGLTVGATWCFWTIKDPYTQSLVTNDDGSSAFPSEGISLVTWNPRPGPVTFVTPAGNTVTWNSKFPWPIDRFTSLNLHAKFQSERLYLTLDYTWTHHWGNIPGAGSPAGNDQEIANLVANDGGVSGDYRFYKAVAYGNNEANPVHELKSTVAYTLPLLGQCLNLGAVFTWTSGIGLTAGEATSDFYPNIYNGGFNNMAPDNIRGNYGNLPSILNLDLNLNMVIKVLAKVSLTPTVSVSNVFNSRAITGKYMNLKLDPTTPDPFFDQALNWQAGRTLTAGLSIKF